MPNKLKSLARYAPLAIGLTVLAAAAFFVPWAQVYPYLRQLSPLDYAILTTASIVYYLGRSIRYWLMARMLGQPASFGHILLACLAAQPIAVLPGGELYRGTMLKRYANVSLKNGVPSTVAQSITESLGLAILALLGAASIHRYLFTVMLLTAIFLAILIFLRRSHSSRTHRIANRLPFVDISRSRLLGFLEKNRTLLTGRNLIILILASYISTFAGIGIVFFASHALGVALSPIEATVAYAFPLILESISFLPGGLGVSEGGSLGVLTVLGVSLAPAIAITLITRIFTLGAGFPYGFAAQFWAKFKKY